MGLVRACCTRIIIAPTHHRVQNWEHSKACARRWRSDALSSRLSGSYSVRCFITTNRGRVTSYWLLPDPRGEVCLSIFISSNQATTRVSLPKVFIPALNFAWCRICLHFLYIRPMCCSQFFCNWWYLEPSVFSSVCISLVIWPYKDCRNFHLRSSDFFCVSLSAFVYQSVFCSDILQTYFSF
jgi:hypothetical protein